MKKRAFTTLEILVVLIVVSIIAVRAIVMYNNSIEKARTAEAITTVSQISKSEELHKLESGSYVAAANTQEINTLLGMNIVPKDYEYLVVNVTEDDFVVLAARIGRDIRTGQITSNNPIVIAMNKSGMINPSAYSSAGGAGYPGVGYGGGSGGSSGPMGGGGGGSLGGGGGGSSGGGGGSESGGLTGSGDISSDSTFVDEGHSPVALADILNTLQGTTYGDYFYNLITAENITVAYSGFTSDGIGGLYLPTWWLDLTTCPGELQTTPCTENSVYINPALATQYGWTAEALACILVHELMHADYNHNQETHVTETISRLGVARDELNWARDAGDALVLVDGSEVLLDSQDQEYIAYKQQVLLWEEIRGTQTNYDLDNLLSYYDQNRVTGEYLKAEVVSRYSTYEPYFIQRS